MGSESILMRANYELLWMKIVWKMHFWNNFRGDNELRIIDWKKTTQQNWKAFPTKNGINLQKHFEAWWHTYNSVEGVFGPGNGLSPVQHQAITWTNDDCQSTFRKKDKGILTQDVKNLSVITIFAKCGSFNIRFFSSNHHHIEAWTKWPSFCKWHLQMKNFELGLKFHQGVPEGPTVTISGRWFSLLPNC